MPRERSTRQQRRSKGQSRDSNYSSVRRFMVVDGWKVLLGIGALTAGGKIGLSIIENLNESQELKGFRETITIPEYSIPTEKQELFLQEGWFDSLFEAPIPDFGNLLPQEQEAFMLQRAQNAFNKTLSAMASSLYQPFREAALLVEEGKRRDVIQSDGAIQLTFGYLTGPDGNTAMVDRFLLTRSLMDPRGFWAENFVVNVFPLDHRFLNQDQRIWIKANWALGICHEILGHYRLDASTIDFLTSGGRDKEEVIGLLGHRDSDQEPYAYAIQASATLPLLGLEVNGENSNSYLAQSHIDFAEKWRSVKEQGLDWTSREWRNYANAFAEG